MKKFIILLLCLGLAGCATARNRFGSIYNEAISNETNTSIIKEGDFKDIWAYTIGHLKSLRYQRTVYSDPNQAFYVLKKDISIVKSFLIGNSKAYKLIVKFTKSEDGNTRIDLVNGTHNSALKKEVDKDIQALADLIKAEP